MVTAKDLRDSVGGECEDCPYYQDIRFGSTGHCNGQMMNCKRGLTEIIIVKVVNDDKRYMSGYSTKRNEWWGEVDGPGTSYTVL
jgi:hypothetical protein